MESFVGVTSIALSVAFVTVRLALSEIEPDEAVMLTFPADNPLTRPCAGAVLLTLATELGEELQLTVPVTSCVEPSEKVPLAFDLIVVYLAMKALVSITLSETKTGGPTVSTVVPLTFWNVACT
jgi:hypothetical protein